MATDPIEHFKNVARDWVDPVEEVAVYVRGVKANIDLFPPELRSAIGVAVDRVLQAVESLQEKRQRGLTDAALRVRLAELKHMCSPLDAVIAMSRTLSNALKQTRTWRAAHATAHVKHKQWREWDRALLAEDPARWRGRDRSRNKRAAELQRRYGIDEKVRTIAKRLEDLSLK